MTNADQPEFGIFNTLVLLSIKLTAYQAGRWADT